MRKLNSSFSMIAVLFVLIFIQIGQQEVFAASDKKIKSEAAVFNIETVAKGFEVPWSMEFLPDGSALVSDRKTGHLQRLNIETGELIKISGLPKILLKSKIGAGLFDVRIHPDFADNGWVYIVYATGSAEASGLVVERMTLKDNGLTQSQRLLETKPRVKGKYHFGGRLVYLNGYLFLTTGDGYFHPHLAQDLTAHQGKVLRIHDNGDIPIDNPFIEVEGALPEIWSFGIRSPQGLAVHPETEQVWANEHGPQGGDEVNIISAGQNYGWPVITYGEEYGGGAIGEGITRKEGLEQPLYYWLPSIGPSGMEIYSGRAFPGWKNSMFTGSLALKHLNRLVLDGERVLHEERLFEDKGWRVRFIEEGPEGFLYFGVDGGKILRLVPAK
jgi:aldose sugar dehydrogenase